MAPCPEGPQPDTVCLQICRDDSEAQTQACETGSLGEGAELDRTASGTLALIDTVRDILFRNISLIGRVVQDNRPVFVGVVHPLLKPVFFHDSTGGIVGEAKIDQIRCLSFRQLRRKTILRRTGHINYILVGARRRIIQACPACHDVGVHIDRVDGIAHRNRIVHTEDLLDITAVALCAVRDKNLLR